MTREEIATALDMLLGFHELDHSSDPTPVIELVELMREQEDAIVDLLGRASEEPPNSE